MESCQSWVWTLLVLVVVHRTVEGPTGTKRAPEFGERLMWVGGVVEGLHREGVVERSVGEGEVVEIADQKADIERVGVRPGVFRHLGRAVETVHPRARRLGEGATGVAAAGAQVEHPLVGFDRHPGEGVFRGVPVALFHAPVSAIRRPRVELLSDGHNRAMWAGVKTDSAFFAPRGCRSGRVGVFGVSSAFWVCRRRVSGPLWPVEPGIENMTRNGRRRRFALADTAQQIVGGFLLAGPFVVTEEVWTLATNMGLVQGAVTVAIVFAIGYGALYKADDDRDPERERDVLGVPIRFVSLMAVSFGSVVVLALVFDAPETFLGAVPPTERLAVTLRAISVGAMFSVVGAATADSVF